ncbi:universal stress protein [Vannielia sp.]|uniref:universal stress protein n=1 Tax=Vannielia sp. TaxID=2813045 RepID=UPI002630ED6F|nr:universal stress protein [Vannielia sp.]MDF1873614.1 universal stress protein [Vannielia sp.]
MDIKTILVPLLEPLGEGHANSRAMQFAEGLADGHSAHLEVIGIGCDRTQVGYYYAGTNALVQQETFEEARKDAEAIKASVKDRLGNSTMRWSVEVGVSQLSGLSQLLGSRARFADLVVMPQPYGNDRGTEYEVALEAAMFDGHAPVMVVPDGLNAPVKPSRAVVAWNQSPEALAAIRRAMPLLRQTDLVNIAIIDPPRHGPDRSDPGGALSQMLSRHGLKCEISVLSKTMPKVSDVLARHASESGADLLVMGAYGHSRFREAILGGATRDILEEPPVPVFMAR